MTVKSAQGTPRGRDLMALHQRHEAQSTADDQLSFAMGVADDAIRAVGPDHIEIVTLTRGRICLQPVDLNEGERIAHTLGCDFPLDHRMFVPGHTLWAGQMAHSVGRPDGGPGDPGPIGPAASDGGDAVNEPKPTAIGYVCGPPGRELEQQHTVVAEYAEAEGLALADVLHDETDACTISQLVDAARLHDATRVILPSGVRLAEARQGIDRDLAEHGAVCVVVGGPDADHAGHSSLTVPVLAGSRRPPEVTP